MSREPQYRLITDSLDLREGKTPLNQYFRDMVEQVMVWGLQPLLVTGDSWYSGVDNLKFLQNQKLGFRFWRGEK